MQPNASLITEFAIIIEEKVTILQSLNKSNKIFFSRISDTELLSPITCQLRVQLWPTASVPSFPSSSKLLSTIKPSSQNFRMSISLNQIITPQNKTINHSNTQGRNFMYYTDEEEIFICNFL